MKKLALVGIGKWGKTLLKEFNDISIITLCYSTGDIQNIKWLKKNYPKITHTKNFDDILNSNVDGVIVATPINTHFEIVKKLLNNNKHVFVEKPLATKKSDASKLISLANKKKLILFVGQIFLYHPVLSKLKSILKNDPIQFVYFEWKKFGTFNENIYYNLLSHDLSLILDLIGIPKKSEVLHTYGTITSTDNLILSFNFNKNKKCLVHIDRFSTSKTKFINFQTKNKILLWNENDLFEYDKQKQKYVLIFSSKKMPLEIESRQFLKNLKNYDYQKHHLEIAYNVVQILEDLQKKL